MLQKKATTDEDLLHWIVSEHLRRMSENQFLEAYDWDDIVADVIEKLGIDAAIDIESIVIRHSEFPKIYLLEDTMLQSLESIKKQGFYLAAATNGYYKYQAPVLQQLGLNKIFDEVITSDKAGFAKPHPSILKSLMDKSEVTAHVGDRIDHDVLLANNLGIPSVFIHRALPAEVRKLPVDKRSVHPRFRKLCKEKWHKENRLRDAPFLENECIPNIVVCSMKELAEEIDKLF